MKWAKQRLLSSELNARFPRAGTRQNLFRHAYYNQRQTGQSVEEAVAVSIEAIKDFFGSDFVPAVR